MDLTGKVALVTGAKRIGSVVARELAARGADVAISYARSKDEAERTAEGVRTAGRRASLFQTDLTDTASCQKLVADAVSALGRLDVFVHMASVYKPRPFAEMTPADFDGSIAVDLRSSLRTRLRHTCERRAEAASFCSATGWREAVVRVIRDFCRTTSPRAE
jgi:NAD(P)-dependent dehydrogenase (short-subunit alcohol dehydrogenase family)